MEHSGAPFEPGLVDPMEALAAVEAAVEIAVKVCAEGLWRCSEGQVLHVVERLHALDGRLATLRLAAVRELDTRGIPPP